MVTATRTACGAWPTCGAPADVSFETFDVIGGSQPQYLERSGAGSKLVRRVLYSRGQWGVNEVSLDESAEPAYGSWRLVR